MSKSRRQSELLGLPGVERSHTSALPGNLPNNSNLGSFAAHKFDKNDLTNASHKQRDWLDGPIHANGRRGT